MCLKKSDIEQDTEERLKKIETEKPDPGVHWPEGCYGAAHAWLLFIGPSPGGETLRNPNEVRERDGGEPMWNVIFNEPDEWKGGFRKSMRPLVEHLVGYPFEVSGKMYAFANLEWNPRSEHIPRMRKGLPHILRMLELTQARIALLMTKSAKRLVIPYLEDEVGITLEYSPVEISIPAPRGKHRSLDRWRVVNSPIRELALRYIFRLPRHPVRIFTEESAIQIAHEIRHAFVCDSEFSW